MTPFVVNIPSDVQDQIREQVLFIAQHSPRNAVRWESRLRAAILSIGDLPAHTSDPAATGHQDRDTCKYVFEKTYLIYYEVDAAKNTATLVNFRHGARRRRPHEP